MKPFVINLCNPQNNTLQAFPEVYKNGSKICAIQNQKNSFYDSKHKSNKLQNNWKACTQQKIVMEEDIHYKQQ